MDAQRSLLIQDLALTWRYSIGNQYEEFSFAEALDTAEVMAEYGLPASTRQILTQLPRPPRRGLELAGRREADRRPRSTSASRATAHTSTRRHAGDRAPARRPLARQIYRAHGNGLLIRERYSSDIAARVYALHGQAAVWQGLNAIADVWRAQRATRSSRARRAQLAVAARAGLRTRGPPVRAPPEGRLALRPGRAARRPQAVRHGHRLAAGELLEPRRAVRARLRVLHARQPGGERDPRLHAHGTARASSGSSAPAPTRCTASRATRSPAPTRCTG